MGMSCSLFFFNDTATTEIYTLSLHDALPIYEADVEVRSVSAQDFSAPFWRMTGQTLAAELGESHNQRSEEHTSELQSRQYLVCRLLLEKKKNNNNVTCHIPISRYNTDCSEFI